jgi:hypothetical protein
MDKTEMVIFIGKMRRNHGMKRGIIFSNKLKIGFEKLDLLHQTKRLLGLLQKKTYDTCNPYPVALEPQQLLLNPFGHFLLTWPVKTGRYMGVGCYLHPSS